jgi:hypothetical protein
MVKPDVELELERDEYGQIVKMFYKNNVSNKESAVEFCAITQSIFGTCCCNDEGMTELEHTEVSQN